MSEAIIKDLEARAAGLHQVAREKSARISELEAALHDVEAHAIVADHEPRSRLHRQLRIIGSLARDTLNSGDSA